MLDDDILSTLKIYKLFVKFRIKKSPSLTSGCECSAVSQYKVDTHITPGEARGEGGLPYK